MKINAVLHRFGPQGGDPRSGITGVGETPYARIEEARAAAVRRAEAASGHGIDQWHRIVEAETHQDALLFASNAKSPPRVFEKMVGDPNHQLKARWADGND